MPQMFAETLENSGDLKLTALFSFSTHLFQVDVHVQQKCYILLQDHVALLFHHLTSVI